ncbi:WD40/YVTN/BNR-like repeat-containing protein [Micromonospora sp. WMMD558]|uniref:WD40/YVTN/BNR-like repeat-containing protein n=1 Tax=Micromonospora sp. WMMD558 TaxID=3403462 RepID=UPI003BF56462
MREQNLDELFAEFEAQALPTFRPPGVPDAQRRLRERQRRRRGLLAGVVTLLLAGPAGAYAVAGRNGDEVSPVPTPSPSVSPSPDDNPVQRRVALPGVAGELRQLRFADARHGWAFFDTCNAADSGAGGCERALGRTTDGGATWREVALPVGGAEPSGPAAVSLLPVDNQRLVIYFEYGYLVTTDGGASFTQHPAGNPPTTAQLALATRSGFVIRCPGDPGTPRCPRQELARVGAGGAPTQPPVTLSADTARHLVEGGDGRLWLAVGDGNRLTVVVSADRATSWRKLPAVSGANRLLVSPDGADVWLVSVNDHQSAFDVTDWNRVWRLVGDSWQEGPGLPDDTFSVAAANGGLLPVSSAYGGGGYVRDGRYTPIPELGGSARADGSDAPTVEVLADDTIVLTGPTATFLGVGSGPIRAWTRLTP